MLGEANKAFELLKQFQSNFPLDNLPNMTLDEYTNLKDEKKYFTYLVEFELKSLGEFGGGDAGTRFGIYRTNKKPKKDYNYDGAYAWQKELGNSADEAFNKIKDEILKIAHFSKNNELSKIDDLTLLFFGFKWKIALLYQNPENMKMFCIFSEQRLHELAKTKLNNPNLKIHEIYTQILEKFLPNKPYKFTEIFNLSKSLWEEFDEKKAQQNGDESRSFWIFPSNPSEFDAVSHFKTHEQKSWEKKVANAKVGDIVFLYITKTDKEHSQSIAIKTKIIDIDESKPLPIMLEIDRLFTHPVPFSYLQEIGINGNIQGARNITKNQADKILSYAQNHKNKGQAMLNSSNASENSHKNPPLNQILYGPPGTGKTYNTINKALEILGIQTQNKSRIELKAEFDKFRQNGQIEFVTFHQSFSYEEFVEGIKPEIAQNSAQTSENVNSKELSYKIEAGIFKQICERALHKEYEILDKETNFQISDTTRVWKISIVAKSEKKLREKILEHCLNNNEIRIGWADYKTDEQVATLGANAQSSIEQFENASAGDMVCVFEGTKGIIRGVGIIDGEFSWDNDNADKDLQRYPRVRKVKWLDKNERDIYDLSGNLTLKTFYPLDRVKAVKLLDRMAKNTKLVVDNTQKPFILIIDEINRGNISKILGELITLIEPSKRIGANEELRVSLPYSGREFDGGKGFGVPSNLYIIGTMNTADRSIALLDTALRRRFDFVEMMPEFSILSENCEGVDLQKLLKAMNERIEFLLDRERTIGHSFFMRVSDLSDLQGVFKNKIIPLLQEYFYDDYAKIQAVLNDNKMIESLSKKDLGVNLSDDFVDDDKKVYRITYSNSWDIETFKKIYKSKNADKSNENDED